MSINDPRDIPGIRVWYSADAQPVLADGTFLSGANSIVDQSGNNRHSTPGANVVKYRTVSGSAGGPSFENPSTGGFTIPTAVLAGTTESEVLVVVKVATANAGNSLWVANNGGGGSEHYSYSDGNIYETYCSHTRFAGAVSPQSVANWNRYNIHSKLNDWQARLNEVVKITSASNTYTIPGSFAFGGGHSNINALWTTLIIYDHKLTAGERADLIAWSIANPSGGTQFTLTAPDPPVDLAIDSVASTSFTFSWSPAGTGDPEDGFDVRLDGGTPIDVGTDLDHTFNALDPLTLYTAEVRAYNAAGDSAWVSIEATTLEMPAGAVFTVDLTIGAHVFSITNECTIDPEDPIQVLDGLALGWSVDESTPWPAQPKPVSLKVQFWSDDVANLDDVVVGTAIACVLTDADTNVFGSFHGRVAGLVAQPQRRGSGLFVQYTVAGVDYTVDLAETPMTLEDRPAEPASDRFDAIVAAAAAAGVTVTPPADYGTAAFEAATVTTKAIGGFLEDHLAQLAVDLGDGPQRHVVVPVVVADVLDHFECVLLDRTVDAALLPATLEVVDGFLTLTFPTMTADGLVDACNVVLEAPWTRLKYRAVNRVTVTGDTVSAETSRPGPVVNLPLTTTLTDQGAADLMAALYLPDVDETNGWIADTLELLAHRDQTSITPAWFPDHRDDPPTTAVYVMPIAVVDIVEAINLAGIGSTVYTGQLTSVSLTFDRRRLLVEFALRRQLPIGEGAEAVTYEWVFTEFPAIDYDDVDAALSYYETRLARRF